MKKFFYILLIFSLPLIALSGNDGKGKTNVRQVSAKVTDTYGEALGGTKVTVKETGEIIFTNFDGVFKLALEPGKVYSLTIETIGYAPKEIKSTELSLFSELSLKEL